MYEGQNPLPINGLSRREEFTKEVGWLKTHGTIKASTEEFRLVLAQAQQGVFDPYRDMIRLNKPA